MSYRLVLAFLVLSLSAASAQTSSKLLVGSLPQHLKAARYGLRVDNGTLSGTGAAVLTRAIARSHYILIGENHLTREIPQFTTAICNVAVTQGLTGMALETSPEAAAFMMRSLDSPDHWQKMVAHTKAYPFSVALLDSKQESDMVANCAKASHNPDFRLWGLDQNFVGSAGWLIDLMLAAHPGPEAKAALLRLKVDVQRDAAAAKANADTLALFLLSAKSDAEIKEAQPAIDRDGGTEVKKIFAQLATSYHTYREHADVQRAKLLKINFRNAMHQIPPSEKSGKIIVKFGEWHLYKGVNSLHDLNLGNYIAEAAEMEGQKPLYICILGAGGKVSAFTQYGQPYHVEEDPTMKDSMYRWMAPFKAARLSGQWTLYDLRALRYESFGPLDSEVRRILDGYDFLIIVPKFTPAEMAE